MKSDDELSHVLTGLCPMHVVLDDTGHIVQAGPVLQKLRPDNSLVARRFLEVFELTRPRAIVNMDGLLAAAGSKLHLSFRTPPQTGLKGVLVPLSEGAVVNLSFGISLLDAVRDYRLTSSDFSATDLAIELLYLVEAKSAAMEASRKLNTRLQGAMIAAEEQAFTDTLTGLKNRRAMDHILNRLTIHGGAFSVMNMDLDYFKAVNDTLGHAAGDHVLQQVARIMVEETRESDTIVRAGGDEFVLILDRQKDPEILMRIADRLISRLEAPISFEGNPCRISASVGIATASEGEGLEPADLLHRADQALYAAKHAGRACHRFYSPDLVSGLTSVAEEQPGRLSSGDPLSAQVNGRAPGPDAA